MIKSCRFKNGVASFYIVAIATLLLTIIAASFAILIISEINRSSNADLSNSAYDSALAGIEDAKAAILKYRECKNSGEAKGEIDFSSNSLTCKEIIHYIEQTEDEDDSLLCDVVGHVLGRISKDTNGEVSIQESKTDGNDTQQAYTCSKVITSKMDDYRASLSGSNPSRIVQFGDTDVSRVKSIRLSWFSASNSEDSFNFVSDTSKLPYTGSSVINPPVISLSFVQTATSFKPSDFDSASGNVTDRGAVFLLPSSTGKLEDNKISQNVLLDSNNHVAVNVPQTVYCDKELYQGFACSTSIALPEPINGTRNKETFMLIVSLPYTQPNTDFSVELCNDDDCSAQTFSGYEIAGGTGNDKIQISGAQIGIDSTGRANDLYRRVEARVDSYDTYASLSSYAIQLFGNDGSSNIEIIDKVTTEYNF